MASPKNGQKKAKNVAPEVHFIMDRSGSMQGQRNATVTGFNEFVEAQPKGTKFSLTQFDGHEGVQLKKTFELRKAPRLTMEMYQPRGLTPLYDAVGVVLGQLLDRDPEGKVVVVIVTDGLENASRDFTRKSVNILIEKAKARDWQVIFMGADIDAYTAAGKIGIARDQTMNYSGTHTQDAYAQAAGSTRAYTTGATTSLTVEDVEDEG